jgi:hypothetical protein
VVAAIAIKAHPLVLMIYIHQNNIITRRQHTLPIILVLCAAMMINQVIVLAVGGIILA